MLLVKTKTGPSAIHGTGLFAAEFVPKGALVWKFSKDVDEAYSPEEARELPEPKRSTILGLHFAYISTQTGRYVLSGDDAKFMNHSFTPTVASVFEDGVEEELGVAARDIKAGDELTVDYRDFGDPIDFEVR